MLPAQSGHIPPFSRYGMLRLDIPKQHSGTGPGFGRLAGFVGFCKLQCQGKKWEFSFRWNDTEVAPGWPLQSQDFPQTLGKPPKNENLKKVWTILDAVGP